MNTGKSIGGIVEDLGFFFDKTDMDEGKIILYEWMVEGSYKTLFAMNETGMFTPKLTKEVMVESAIKICGLNPMFKIESHDYKMNKGNEKLSRLDKVEED